MSQPRFSASAASLRATIGEMLDISISSVPDFTPAKIPCSPAYTSSTSGESGSMVMMISLRCRDFFRIRRCLRAFFTEFVYRRAAAIVNDQRVARLQKIARHGFAHDAETDETDGRIAHRKPPTLIIFVQPAK